MIPSLIETMENIRDRQPWELAEFLVGFSEEELPRAFLPDIENKLHEWRLNEKPKTASWFALLDAEALAAQMEMNAGVSNGGAERVRSSIPNFRATGECSGA